MAASPRFMRYASPNERRTIARENLNLYHAIVIGGIYELPEQSRPLLRASLIGPLKACIETHPFLGVTVQDAHTEKPYYTKVDQINLEHHVSVEDLDSQASPDLTAISCLVALQIDIPFTDGIPPWRLMLLSLGSSQYFIAFAYSHTISDGMGGIALHRTLFEAFSKEIEDGKSSNATVAYPHHALGEPFDTPQRLPVSWSFLLKPLLAHLLPAFLAELVGIRADTSGVDEHTWTGANVPLDPRKSNSGLKIYEVDAAVLSRAVSQAREHGATFTGLVNQVIACALARQDRIPANATIISQTAVNMRRSVGVSQDEMGEFASGCYSRHDVSTGSDLFSEEDWAQARAASRQFAAAAVSLKDQPIALLRYASNIRGWLLSKRGEKRDGSFENSNLGLIDFKSGNEANGGMRLVKMLFAQPGHIMGPPLVFNLVSVKGGTLIYTVTWQIGALGIDEKDEASFVDGLSQSIATLLQSI